MVLKIGSIFFGGRKAGVFESLRCSPTVFFFFIFVGENLKFVELEFWGKNIWNSFVE